MPTPTRYIAYVLALLLVGPALADPPANTELNGDPIDTRTYRAWAGNFRALSRYCAQVDGEYIIVPGYERRTPNSRGLSRAQATDELTVTWRESRGGISQNRMREPEPEEVQAYTYGLPSIDVGTYGYIHSLEVVQVLGPEEMLVKEIWLIDARALRTDYDRDRRRAQANGARDFREQLDQIYEHRFALQELQEDEQLFDETHRLVGYSTRGLRAGERWEGNDRDGIQIALARWEVPETDDEGESRRRRRSEEPRLLLINPQQAMRDTLDEQGMIRLLDARGFTVASFVESMREIRERFRDRDEANQRLMHALLPPHPDDEEDED